MAAPQNSPAGFPPHVWDQLQQSSHQLAQQNRGNRRARGPSRGHQPSFHHHQQPRQQQPQYIAHNEAAAFQNQQATPLSGNDEAFPPLGTVRPSASSNVSLQPQYHPPSYHQSFHDFRHNTAREYQDRARGDHRGRPGRFGPAQYPSPAVDQNQYHAYGRAPARHNNLFNPNGGMGFGTVEQQRNMRHVIIKQADYLNNVGRKAHSVHRLSRDESLAKENFRQQLEQVARNTIQAKYPDFDIGNVKLKCYGSLANGFALAGCDMDLLLSLPSWSQEAKSVTVSDGTGVQGPEFDDDDEELSFNMEVRRLLEKAFLDQGYGARLLTNTRVPILRICESPTPDLLKNLRENRAAWEKASFETPAADADPLPAENTETPPDVDTIDQALTDLKITNDGPRTSTSRGNAGLEFTKDCGIQCDINFTNFVALHNSALLKLYHGYDQRVGDIGVFVKIWAKARDINTPYHGTLSSYGYILMVLHYLMNIASPAVIPNLQHLAKVEDGWNPGQKVELFEGFDIRFLQDSNDIEDLRRNAMPKNHESAGQLLRGFFQYYATREGFHWTRDVISIRHNGGILSKQSKGWTEAKWSQKGVHNVRLRYLLAIEDPFETEHNIARTVGHNGLVAIRNEFRRAWAIIERIGTGEEVSIDEFLEPVTDRVDTLRMDLEFHRQKQKQMKKELEAKEKNVLEQAKILGVEDADGRTDGTSGTSDHANVQSAPSMRSQRRPSSSKLTSTTLYQDGNRRLPSKNWRHRKVEVESDDDEPRIGSSLSDRDPREGRGKSRDRMDDTSVTLGSPPKIAKPSQGLCSPGEVLLANGLDHWGRPVAWDIETQDGRWLHWRDNKIKKGTYRQFSNPTLRELDDQCPFDPSRPDPYIGQSSNSRFEQSQRPPWPANRSLISASSNLPARHQSQLSPGDPVGELIDWDSTTVGGQFLLYRDKRIRQGKWEHHKRSRFTELDSAFPYNPMMTRGELEDKNGLLRTYYRTTTHRRKTYQEIPADDACREAPISEDEAQMPSLSGEQTIPTGSSYVPPSQGENLPRQSPYDCTHSQSALAITSSVHDEKSSTGCVHQAYEAVAGLPTTSVVGESCKPDADFVRSQRLAFFAKQASASESDARANSRFYQQSVGEELESMENDPTRRPLTSHEVSTENPVEELSEPENPSLDEPSLVQDEGSLPVESGSLEDRCDLHQQTLMEALSVKIPATLYPGVESSERPRDEDPQIMPIPREFGFRFDPRQLRDLTIIAQGGNGCAREGAEFNIEDDYEWGGGGMMGWKTGSIPQDAGLSIRDSTHEAGQGDQEGLLDELPRDL